MGDRMTNVRQADVVEGNGYRKEKSLTHLELRERYVSTTAFKRPVLTLNAKFILECSRWDPQLRNRHS